jgi:transcription termination factor Rho
MEHILHETSWRVALTPDLATRRLYPAIEITRCQSRDEERLLAPDAYEPLLLARSALAHLSARDRYNKLMDTIESTADNLALIRALGVKAESVKKKVHPLFSALPEETNED